MKKLLISLLAFLVMSPCFADTLIVYPDAGSGNTTVDGYMQRTGVNQTFAAIIAGAGTGSGDAEGGSNSIAWIGASTTTNQFDAIRRGIFTFDASALDNSAVISAASVSTYGTNKINTLGTDTVVLVDATPASNNAIVNADYGELGSTLIATITYASYSTSGYNAFSITGADLSLVSKTGISKFGIQSGWDYSGTFGGSWSSGDNSQFYMYSSDQVGTTTDPKLTITYTLPTAPVFAASPTVDTIATETATGHANITSDGDDTITERGWVLDTSTAPITTDTKFTTAGTTGSYDTDFTSLTAGTHYYARPHAINSIGTTYGDEVEFDTLSAASGAFFQFFD